MFLRQPLSSNFLSKLNLLGLTVHVRDHWVLAFHSVPFYEQHAQRDVNTVHTGSELNALKFLKDKFKPGGSLA